MARRPQGSVRRNPRLKQGKPKPPGVGRPSPRPKKSKGPAGGPKPKGRINPQKPKGFPDRFERFKPKIDRNPTVQGRAMGGEAQEGAAKGALKKKRKTARQQELMDMLKRLYGNQSRRMIVPKKKPRKDK